MAGGAADIPDRFARHLIRTERIVVAVRRHPAQVVEPVLSAVAALVVVLWLLTRLSPDVDVVPDVLWTLWLVVLLRALWHLYEWSQDWFVVTDRRLMLNYGVLTRRVAMMPLTKVTDMSYNRSIPGRILGFGEFVLESAGQDQALSVVSWLPNPDSLYRLICAELFGNENDIADVEADLPPVSDPRGPVPLPLPPPPPEPPVWRGFRLGPGGQGPGGGDSAGGGSSVRVRGREVEGPEVAGADVAGADVMDADVVGTDPDPAWDDDWKNDWDDDWDDGSDDHHGDVGNVGEDDGWQEMGFGSGPDDAAAGAGARGWRRLARFDPRRWLSRRRRTDRG